MLLSVQYNIPHDTEELISVRHATPGCLTFSQKTVLAWLAWVHDKTVRITCSIVEQVCWSQQSAAQHQCKELIIYFRKCAAIPSDYKAVLSLESRV